MTQSDPRPEPDRSGANTGARKRLAVLTPSADLYGSDRSLLHAMPGLCEAFDVTLISAADGPLLDRCRSLGAECIVSADWALRRSSARLSGLPATTARVGSTLRLLRDLHRDRPFAGVYANTLANAALPFLKRTLKVPVIVHIRELPRDRPRQLKMLLRMVDRVADKVICNSSFTASEATRFVPSLGDRVFVVMNSVLEPGRTPAAPASPAPFRVSCVGRIHPKKGQGVLIEAARLAAAAGASWHLDFHGDALPEHRDLEASLHEMVRAAGLEDSVTWHGYDGDTDALYDGAHVAVVPSVLPEEFSLVTAEAQIRGLAVVATGPGGPSEIIDDGRTGLIVAPDDAPALAAALSELESDRARLTQFGRAGARRAREQFSVARYREEIVRRLVDATEHPPALLVATPSADLYGSDRALLHALPAMAKTHPTIVMSAQEGPFVDRARAAGAAVIVLPDFAVRRRYMSLLQLPGMARRCVRFLREGRKLVRRHGVGLVYVNTVAVPVLPLMRRVLNRPVLVHVHERALGGRIETTVLRQLVQRGVHSIVVNSHFTAASLPRRGPHLVYVVYNGIEATDRIPDRDARPAERIVCPARLHPKKGQRVLIEAVDRLRSRGVDVEVDLVGDALPEHFALEAELRRLVDELRLGDRVHFVGHRSEIESIYRGHGIVVVPSVVPEEFSLVAAEGQMRGLAAIVSGPGGASEVIADGDTGLVVTPGAVDELAAAIEKLAADPTATAQMGERGRDRMLAKFTVARYRANLMGILDPIVREDH